MKNLKATLAGVLLLLSTLAFSQGNPPAPGPGTWMVIDTTYQLGTLAQGNTQLNLTFRNNSASLITGLQFRFLYDPAAFSSATVALSGPTTNLILEQVNSAAAGSVTVTLVYTGTSSSYTIPDETNFVVTLNHIESSLFESLPSIADIQWATPASFQPFAALQSGLDGTLGYHSYGGEFIYNQLQFSGTFTNVSGSPAKFLPFSLEKKLKTSPDWTVHQNYTTGDDGFFAINEQIDTTFYDVRLAIKGDTMSVGNIISTADAQLINQWVLGNGAPAGFDYYAADVNESNNITISDAYGVFGRISGRFNSWPNNVEDIKFFTSTEYATITGNPSNNYTGTIPGVTNFYHNILPGQPSNVTFYVLAPGDANQTGYHMARITPVEIINPDNAPYYIIDESVEYDANLTSVEINLPNISVVEGDKVEVPVKLISGSNKVGALQMGLKYDQSLLEFLSMTNSEKAMSWVSYLNPTEGIVEWGGYDPSYRSENSFTNNESIFTLTFQTKRPQELWTQSPLYTSRKFVGDENGKDMNITAANGVLEIRMIDVNEVLDETNMEIFPNPTEDNYQIAFEVSKPGNVELAIFDAMGRKKEVVINQRLSNGKYIFRSSAIDLNSGTYKITLITENSVLSKSLVVTKK